MAYGSVVEDLNMQGPGFSPQDPKKEKEEDRSQHCISVFPVYKLLHKGWDTELKINSQYIICGTFFKCICVFLRTSKNRSKYIF